MNNSEVDGHRFQQWFRQGIDLKNSEHLARPKIIFILYLEWVYEKSIWFWKITKLNISTPVLGKSF